MHMHHQATDGYTFWFFDEQYTIRSAPAESGCPWVVIAPDGRRLPTCIEDRLIICWAGEGEPDKPKIEPGTLLPPAHYDIHTELIVEDIPVEWGLLVENLLDLAHAPFTHTARAPVLVCGGGRETGFARCFCVSLPSPGLRAFSGGRSFRGLQRGTLRPPFITAVPGVHSLSH